MDSNRWVATMQRLPSRAQVRTNSRCAFGSVAMSISMPRSPRATITPSALWAISSTLRKPSLSSILAMILQGGVLGAQEMPRLHHVLLGAHEGERQEVHLLRHGEHDVVTVLDGDGRQVHMHAGQIDVLAAAQRAAIDHPAAQPRLGFVDDQQVDEAVVQRERAAGFHGFGQMRVVHEHLPRRHRRRHGQRDLMAPLQRHRRIGVAGADLRALGCRGGSAPDTAPSCSAS